MQAWAKLTGNSWARLDGTQDSAGQTLLTLDRVVGNWAVGDEIVIGTTDWYPSHSEVRTVRAITTVMTAQGARTQLSVDVLEYPHVAQIFDTDALQQQNGATFTGPVNRKAADLRAPVGLLSRSVQIRSLGVQPQRQPTDPGFPDVASCLYTSTATTDPNCYFGGHVMVRQGFREAQIQGVEFKQLGQGGRMGHYPVHFHLAKSTAYTQGKAFVKDSALWDSMTRFVVLHGSHDVTVARNVGYLSLGHGYYIEDGSEIGNKLCHNLGVAARAALQEYFAAQADSQNWGGTPPAPSLAARFVPPIYSSTTQPSPSAASQTIDPHQMIVLDAAVGWKQPNGFYYPPAFTYRGSTFFKTLPTGLPDPDPTNPLNQCFSFGASNNYMSPIEQPGDCRHNVIDRTHNYIQGSMLALNGGPGTFPASINALPTTPIDFSTILIDLDGSLTGADGMISGITGPVSTTSLSRNAFFDAPAQTDECLSFGLQTSPYEFVTTLVAPLAASPPVGGSTYIDPVPWKSPANANTPGAPLVAIYRQWATADDPASCGQICSGSTYGCLDSTTGGGPRGSFMVGPNVSQAPYLTMAIPPGLTSQPGSLYYVDTSTGSQQPIACVTAKTADMFPATFNANSTYVVYDLFARNDAVVSYQFFVGDGVNGLAAVQGKYVRVNPHLHVNTNDPLDDFRAVVDDTCDPTSGTGWCAGLPVPTVQNGILTVTLDQRGIAADFQASAREDYERCMPRDLCYFDGTQCQPCASNPSQCIRQGDFLAVDVQTLNQTDATGNPPLDVICHDWATFSSGTTTNTPGELSLVDCPANGCLGFAFTLPSTFVGNKTYQDVGAPLAQCFQQASWITDNKLIERTSLGQPADPLCGAPRPAVPADFCMSPSPTPTP